MLFNSFEFLFLFLPVVLIFYYLLNYFGNYNTAKGWLLLASLTFYGWFKVIYIPFLLTSIVVNYFIALALEKPANNKKLYLTIGVVFNVALLFYFKYTNFFIDNINAFSTNKLEHLHILLPIGISFYTFQQISYIVDKYYEPGNHDNFLDYSLFVSFFPHITSGPIERRKLFMPQLKDSSKGIFDAENFSRGLYIFLMGLCKKLIVADSFAVIANGGYAQAKHLSFMDSWITTISYSIQLYFDFSGYSEMALGVALMFNFGIIVNFNSPYKATDLQDFWRRWHISLSSFLRDYIYIPLGGNRSGEFRTLLNLFLTFLIGGIWHGASWTFVIWGAMHGIGVVVHRMWKKAGKELPAVPAYIVTMLYVNLAWVFFRATNFADAISLVRTMFGFNGISIQRSTVVTDMYLLPMLALGVLLLFFPNPPQFAARFKTDYKHMAFICVLFLIGLIFLNSITANDFLYFDF